MRVDIALGFGLFAILSIIRVRSSVATRQEVAYYFVGLVSGTGQRNEPGRPLVVAARHGRVPIICGSPDHAIPSSSVQHQSRELREPHEPSFTFRTHGEAHLRVRSGPD